MNLNKSLDIEVLTKMYITIKESSIKEWGKPKYLKWDKFIQSMNDTEENILYSITSNFGLSLITVVGNIVNEDGLEQTKVIQDESYENTYMYIYYLGNNISMHMIKTLKNEIESELTYVENIKVVSELENYMY